MTIRRGIAALGMAALGIILLVHSGNGIAAEAAGRLIYVSGEVVVERGGKAYRGVRRAPLRSGDLIRTGQSGRAHLRLSDRTLISLKPGTEFLIKSYRYSAALAPASTTSAPRTAEKPQGDRSFFGLIKGGFRAITGLIGQQNKSAFGVDTPVATIGIRGTTFTVELLPAQAIPSRAQGPDGWPLLAQAGGQSTDLPSGLLQSAANGLGLRVSVGEGRVVVKNTAGELELANGETGLVSGAGEAPRRLLRPSVDSEAQSESGQQFDEDERETRQGDESGGDGLASQDGGQTDTKADGSSGSSSDSELATRTVLASDPVVDSSNGPSGSPEAPELVPPETEIIDNRRSLAVVSALQTFGLNSQSLDSDEAALSLREQHVDGLQSAYDRGEETAVPAALSLSSEGAIQNAGFDPNTGLRWGRWAGAQAQLEFADGTTNTLDTNALQLHLVQGSARSGEIIVPSTGTADYQLIGNTDPTSSSGAIGVLGDARLQANFDAQTVQSELALSMSGQVWSATGGGQMGNGSTAPAHLFAGDYTDVQIDGQAAGSGEFSGFFTPQGQGAGLAYRLNGDAQSIHGTAAFAVSAPQ